MKFCKRKKKSHCLFFPPPFFAFSALQSPSSLSLSPLLLPATMVDKIAEKIARERYNKVRRTICFL